MSIDEMETNFTIEATDRSVVNIFSNDKVWQRRIEALGIVPYLIDGYGRFYRVSLGQYNFGLKRKRVLTDEQRQAMAERMRVANHDATGKIQV